MLSCVTGLADNNMLRFVNLTADIALLDGQHSCLAMHLSDVCLMLMHLLQWVAPLWYDCQPTQNGRICPEVAYHLVSYKHKTACLQSSTFILNLSGHSCKCLLVDIQCVLSYAQLL